MEMIEQRKRNGGQGGFTLIELLVVIAILAILAGVAVFAVGNLTTDADVNACKLEEDTFDNAVEAYKAQNAVYPTGDAEWIQSAGADADTAGLKDTPKYFSIEYAVPVDSAVAPTLSAYTDGGANPAPDGKRPAPADCIA
jgi:prepilin-type N-terminal cleavage/methylation domain-containing protein